MTEYPLDPAAASARAAAQAFVRDEAGFAQVTTLDRHGYPVARTVTAFLQPDWSVALVQRRTHARLAQVRREPRVLVAWVGEPAPGATNERPHVFDIGRLPPRAVFVRGTARFMDDDWTVDWYQRQLGRQHAQGFTRAPLRTPEQVVADLVGVHVQPYRVRLEGFGEGAQSFDWTLAPPADLTFDSEGEQ
jgi:hypothetical protein